MTRPDLDWLLDAVADPANGWSVGTFGAIAEFTRDGDEPVVLERFGGRAEAATARGAFRLELADDLRPVAYETPNRDGETWSHAVALCLPGADAAMHRRTALTELGPDRDAIRPEDRDVILFDMGLGTVQVDVCIRTAEPELIATLRSAAGRSLFEPGNPAMGAVVAAGPHRVFVGRLGRGEVYQPIPSADGQSPDGPHTHVLPKLLRTGRTHSATTPIPDGLVPAAHLFPPNPLKDQADRQRSFPAGDHAAFASLFERYGVPDLIRLRREVRSAVRAGVAPREFQAPGDKHSRASLRVTLRRLAASDGASAAWERWSRYFDRGPSEDQVDELDEQPVHAP